jgi:nucleoid-associated protein YgaU
MGRETKIGLAVLGILSLVFGTLLFRKLVTSDMTGGPAEAMAAAASRHETAAGAAEKRRVVINEKNPAERVGAGRRDERAESAVEVPPAKPLPPDRYADQRAASAVDDEPPAQDPAVRSNPFQNSFSTTRADSEPRDDGASDAPRRLDETPHEPARLEAHDERPLAPVRPRNPLRRVSAEEPLSAQEPLNDNAPGSEAVPDNTAAPEVQVQPQDQDSAAADPPGPQPRLAAARDEDPAPVEAARDPEPRQPIVQAQLPRDDAFERQPVRAIEPVVPENGKYTVQPNDNLWIISEKVYGSGRYFKAIYEHNRGQLPHADQLAVGTVIAVPPAGVLEQNYPALCPKQRKSALVKPRAVQASTRPSTSRGENVYVVEEGDTLFDIARYELGKASRWSEIYDLNREVLGGDFDYLQPGTELAMPAKTQAADSITRQRGSRLQR